MFLTAQMQKELDESSDFLGLLGTRSHVGIGGSSRRLNSLGKRGSVHNIKKKERDSTNDSPASVHSSTSTRYVFLYSNVHLTV